MNVHVYCTLNRFAVLDSEHDNKERDRIMGDRELNKLASKYGIFVSYECIEDVKGAMVLHNSKPVFDRIYGYECFDCNLPMKDTSTFESRTNEFIKSLKAFKQYEDLVNFVFNEPKCRLFVCN